MEEFKRMIVKVSNVQGQVATIPSTNDHTDGSWLVTDIYEGELFLNVVDNILQTRTISGIVTLVNNGGASVDWGNILGTISSQTDLQNALDAKQDVLINQTNIKSINGVTLLGSGDLTIDTSTNWGDIGGTLSSQTDLQSALDSKINYADYTPSYSLLVQQSGVGSPTPISVGVNTLVGRTNSGGSDITDLSVTEVKEMLGDDTLIETVTLSNSRALLLTDKNKNIENTIDVGISVPTNAVVAFPIGTQIFFTKKAESLTIVPDSGVTINSVDGLLELGRINCGASLLKIGTDEWNLIGELV